MVHIPYNMHQCGKYNNTSWCGINKYTHHLDAMPHFNVMLLHIQIFFVKTLL